jgi:hypothetical protein
MSKVNNCISMQSLQTFKHNVICFVTYKVWFFMVYHLAVPQTDMLHWTFLTLTVDDRTIHVSVRTLQSNGGTGACTPGWKRQFGVACYVPVSRVPSHWLGSRILWGWHVSFPVLLSLLHSFHKAYFAYPWTLKYCSCLGRWNGSIWYLYKTVCVEVQSEVQRSNLSMLFIIWFCLIGTIQQYSLLPGFEAISV